MDLDAPPMTDRVSLREELEAVGIEEILTQLDRELIGLKPVKTRIREIASLLLIERIRKRMNLTSDRKSTRLNSSHANISYAVFCLKKKNNTQTNQTNPRNQNKNGAPTTTVL